MGADPGDGVEFPRGGRVEEGIIGRNTAEEVGEPRRTFEAIECAHRAGGCVTFVLESEEEPRRDERRDEGGAQMRAGARLGGAGGDAYGFHL